MATLLKSDGTKETITPANGKTFTLKEMQTLVGGFIQIIGLPNGANLVMNEDGKIEELPYNLEATLLGEKAGIATEDYIVGDVVLCENGEADD